MSKQNDNSSYLNGVAKTSQDEQPTISNIEKRVAYRMNIAGQKIKRSVVTEIGKFAILWNHFEDFHCHKDCNFSEIKRIADSITIDEERKNTLRIALNHRMEKYGDDVIYYVHHGLYPDGSKRHNEDNENKKSYKECECYMNYFINNDANQINNTIGCLLVIYQIRNNMMHGLKDIHDLEGQLELFQAVNRVLEDL